MHTRSYIIPVLAALAIAITAPMLAKLASQRMAQAWEITDSHPEKPAARAEFNGAQGFEVPLKKRMRLRAEYLTIRDAMFDRNSLVEQQHGKTGTTWMENDSQQVRLGIIYRF